jgi:hypothetical protein
MVIHIAIYKWKSGVTKGAIEEAISEIKTLKNKVNGILDIRCGENYSKWSEGYTHAFLVLCKDNKALDAYRNHPDHLKIAKVIDEMDGGSIGIDFED